MKTPHVYLCVAVMAVVAALSVRAQSVAQPAQPFTSTAPQQVNGFVTMSSGLAVDGGVTTSALSAASIRTDTLSVDAGTSLRDVDVAGAATFRSRPTGVVLSSSVLRAAALTVGVGCSTLGVTRVAGSLAGDGCSVSAIPSAALAMGITYDCYVLADNSVTVRACGLVSVAAAPAGTYQVRVVGP